jgi:hypothetical protein
VTRLKAIAKLDMLAIDGYGATGSMLLIAAQAGRHTGRIHLPETEDGLSLEARPGPISADQRSFHSR